MQARKFITDLLNSADVRIDGARPWDIRIHDARFFDRVMSDGKTGLGESYMDGWWDCDALDQMICRVLRADLHGKLRRNLSTFFLHLKARFLNMQSKSRSQRDVSSHYDRGNELYFTFLDPYYQYSCAYFEGTDDLNEAQEKKLDLICRKLRIRRGDKVLDVGCGWGGLAQYLAEHRGCHVTGVTLSREQAEFARKLCKGLPVEIQLCDYRDMEGQFDKIVSVGMFEHVGYKNHGTFMKAVNRCLKPGGILLLHTIGGNRSYQQSDPWLNKYIFPNALVPSLEQINRAINGIFVMEDLHNFGPYYAKTLRAWKENFDRCWHKISDRYGERFYRMWTYYLLVSAGTFDARFNHVWQIVLSPGGVRGGYRSVR